MITGQNYNTNTADFVTNYFQAYDLPLANGTNAITLHATDFAGNVTTISTNIIYVADTNPPIVSLIWPQDGMQISATNFTIQGQVDDPTATVSATLVDANGNTNLYSGLTGRDGNFWVQNVPMPAGISTVSLTINDGSGSTTTNFTVSQSSVALSINPVSAGDTLVGGTIGVTGYTIWANGVLATQTNGSWTAQITPIGVGGGVVNVMAVPDAENASYNMGRASASSQSADSNSAQSANTQATVQPPQGVFTSTFERNYEDDYSWYTYGSLFKSYNIDDYQDGQPGSYTTFYLYTGYTTELYTANWGAANWPQMPSGPSTDISGYVQEVIGTNWDRLNFANTNLGMGGPSIIGSAHCNTKQIRMVSPGVPLDNIKNIEDVELKLATGGPLGSKQLNLWILTPSASDIDTGEQIPYDQISVGGFGSPDTNGELYVALPDNDPDTVTVHASGHKNYAFSVSAKKLPLNHQVDCVALGDTNLDRTTLGIGEMVYLNKMPTETMWSLAGGGKISSTNGGSIIYRAPLSPGSATVTATYKGQHVSVVFSVIPPSSITAVSYVDLNDGGDDPAGTMMGEQVLYTDILGPKNVSFVNVNFRELQNVNTNVIWPSGTNENTGFDMATNGLVLGVCSNSFVDLVGFPLVPASRLFNGSNYMNFSFSTTWYDQYQDDSGNWINFYPLTATWQFRGSDKKCQVIYLGMPSDWQGPFDQKIIKL